MPPTKPGSPNVGSLGPIGTLGPNGSNSPDPGSCGVANGFPNVGFPKPKPGSKYV